MTKKFITVRVYEKTKNDIERIKHEMSIEEKKNLNLSETLDCLVETYYRMKDLEY